MLITISVLRQELSEKYQNPDMKIGRMVKNGELFRVKRGIYETNRNVESYYLAGAIYGPSYLSFEYMLAYYDLIPEYVYGISSATCRKKKKKEYTNVFGTYYYQDVPAAIFPYGFTFQRNEDYVSKLATPEKALCDKLYTMYHIHNQNDMAHTLIENLRIDEEDLRNLSMPDLKFYAEHYPSQNVRLLYPTIKRKL